MIVCNRCGGNHCDEECDGSLIISRLESQLDQATDLMVEFWHAYMREGWQDGPILRDVCGRANLFLGEMFGEVWEKKKQELFPVDGA